MQRIIDYCINQFGTIYKKCNEIENLNTLLIRFLPIEFHENCHVGSFNMGCLTIITNDASWASQLRYIIPELRDQLRTEGNLFQLSSIKIRIANDESTKQQLPHKPIKLSYKAREVILSESKHCTDEQLKEALIKLAKP